MEGDYPLCLPPVHFCSQVYFTSVLSNKCLNTCSLYSQDKIKNIKCYHFFFKGSRPKGPKGWSKAKPQDQTRKFLGIALDNNDRIFRCLNIFYEISTS